MQLIAPNIWTHDGSTVPFYTIPFTTRMTVVRLGSGGLWIHSPEKLVDQLVDELAALGPVEYLVSPNKLHHLFISEWTSRYPNARSYGAPGLVRKWPDVAFDAELKDGPEPDWDGEIDQLVFRGSFVMEEVVFFHKASRTLILTDLIENFPASHLQGWKLHLAKMAGIIAPNGRTPLDWRLTFSDRKTARACLNKMISWQPQNIIVSHGKCVFGGGTEFLERSFSWLT